jgi:hypothetical protein
MHAETKHGSVMCTFLLLPTPFPTSILWISSRLNWCKQFKGQVSVAHHLCPFLKQSIFVSTTSAKAFVYYLIVTMRSISNWKQWRSGTLGSFLRFSSHLISATLFPNSNKINFVPVHNYGHDAWSLTNYEIIIRDISYHMVHLNIADVYLYISYPLWNCHGRSTP